MTTIQEAATLAVAEAEQARAQYKPFNSLHEGYAVLKEEVDELWDAIKANDTPHAHKEAIQVAAMALRFISDCETIKDSDFKINAASN